MIINNINKTKIIAGPMLLHPHPLFINFPPFISLIISYGKSKFLCMIFFLQVYLVTRYGDSIVPRPLLRALGFRLITGLTPYKRPASYPKVIAPDSVVNDSAAT